MWTKETVTKLSGYHIFRALLLLPIPKFWEKKDWFMFSQFWKALLNKDLIDVPESFKFCRKTASHVSAPFFPLHLSKESENFYFL